MNFSLDEVHHSWRELFAPHVNTIQEIFTELAYTEFTPARENIFSAFQEPLDSIKVVIVGQDPYPQAGDAHGLAFSVAKGRRIPASLRNIFKEYQDDLGFPSPTSGLLSPWSREGVLLLNRVLTTEIGKRNAHHASHWAVVTEDLARHMGESGVVAILWGSSAHTLSQYFKDPILSPHPSPLSAYRGFFGSKPFTKTNALLVNRGKNAINWELP
jgi:uracil-DNA glycosylase